MFNEVIRLKWFGSSIVIFLILFILPSFIPRFYTYILALIYVTSLLAMSLNLVVGHGGLFQFHHGVFYGVGAYTVALMLKKTSLPMWAGFIAGPIVAAMIGLIIGWLCVRLSRLYFGMLQISLGSLIWVIVFRWYS
ncbi:MAG: branched-chain amino acid ABC transporter permease, partial [Deltaproteobacteria bacterium]|nr:branched-chain amino acid ABC transporter permease [Deltaproteobacteria bacterium]